MLIAVLIDATALFDRVFASLISAIYKSIPCAQSYRDFTAKKIASNIQPAVGKAPLQK
jgi:hypothetical protein